MDVEQQDNPTLSINDEPASVASNGTNGVNGGQSSAQTDTVLPYPVEDVAESSETSAPVAVTLSKAELKRKTEDYLTSRWQDQYDYYSQKATANKKVYQRIRLTVALIGFMIPVAVTLPDVVPTIVPALLGVAVSFLTAWETIYRYGDNWRSFRQASEELKRERVYFESGAGPYARLQSHEAFVRFVENCEVIMAQESGSFFKRDAQNQQGGDQSGLG